MISISSSIDFLHFSSCRASSKNQNPIYIYHMIHEFPLLRIPFVVEFQNLEKEKEKKEIN